MPFPSLPIMMIPLVDNVSLYMLFPSRKVPYMGVSGLAVCKSARYVWRSV